MNLVDDDRVYRAQGLGGLRGEQQIKRLRRGDENLGRMAGKASPLPLRRVAGSNADGGFCEGNAHAASHVGNAGQGRAQVALHIDGESLERRNVNDAAALLPTGFVWMEHEPVKAPEKCRERLTGPGGSQDQCVFSACDHWPAHPLRSSRRVKDSAKPGCRDGMKAGERIGYRSRNRGGVGFRLVRVGPVGRHAAMSIAHGEEEAKARSPEGSTVQGR